MLLVSHDRAFLDNVVTSVIAAEGEGRWREYVGGFTDWQMQSARAQQIADARNTPAREASAAGAPKDRTAGRNAQRAVKLSFKEQKELDALPARIEALEAEQKTIGARLEDGSLFATDAEEGARLSGRYGQIDEELLAALERWEALEAKRK